MRRVARGEVLVSWLTSWFSFPNGSVLTNLIASVIGFVVGYFATIHRHFRKLHKSHEELHRKIDEASSRE